MKTLLSILLLLLACPVCSRAQALVIDSTRFITGINCCAIITYALPTADEGFLFVGRDSYNPGGIIPYFFDTSDNGNVLIGKIDSNRQISWIKVYGGSQSDGGGASVQTPDGGYAVLAGTTSNDGDVTGYLGGGDMWLLRLDDSGKLLWEKCFGSTLNDLSISIANTPDHGFILLGATNGSDHDVPFHYGDFFSMDWIVIKIDSLGNVQWSKDLGGTGDEGESGAILTIDNSYYLVSSSNSHDHDCTDTSWHAGATFSDENYYILKLDDTGKVLWDSSYGGSGAGSGAGGDQLNYAIFDTRDSSIVCNGYTNSDDYMVTGYHGSQDMWVIKLNKNGTLLWQKALGSSVQENGTGICIAHDAGYIVYGSTFPGPIGQEDCWIFALDNSGNEISDNIFGGSNYENPFSVLPYLNGYVATGLSSSNIFTEGANYGNFDSVGGGFISYIDTGTLSISNVYKLNFAFTAYPNPTDGITRIFPPDNQLGNLTIINSIGQIVDKIEIQQHAVYTEINTGIWTDGLYIIKWQGEDGTVMTAKFVKN